VDTILKPLYYAVSWIDRPVPLVLQPHLWARTVARVGLSIRFRWWFYPYLPDPLFVKQIKSTRNMQALQRR